jgi:hypothetical protein
LKLVGSKPEDKSTGVDAAAVGGWAAGTWRCAGRPSLSGIARLGIGKTRVVPVQQPKTCR